MHKLEADKKKSVAETTYTVVVGSSIISNPHLSLLADSFDFNLSFLTLPDVISNSIPVPFL